MAVVLSSGGGGSGRVGLLFPISTREFALWPREVSLRDSRRSGCLGLLFGSGTCGWGLSSGKWVLPKVFTGEPQVREVPLWDYQHGG